MTKSQASPRRPVRLPIDDILYAKPTASPIVEATLALVLERIRDKLTTHLENGGASYDDFVFGSPDCGVTRKDFEAVETALLASGHRFDWSAAISAKERPEAYKGSDVARADLVFEHPDAVVEPAGADGRARCGQGDNVVRRTSNVIGIARYVRTNERVLAWLADGVPHGTIAIIDDSGGTLTAPIIDQFAGILCAGGTIRSHLGILSREFGIPCFMNAKLNGVRDGDRIEMEASAEARTTEDYQSGAERTGRVWLLKGGA